MRELLSAITDNSGAALGLGIFILIIIAILTNMEITIHTEKGLLGFNNFVIDSTCVYLLRDKNCVCIWCNADEFVKKYGLKGFYTGMIISEYEEAIMCCVPTNSHWIAESNTDFALAIKKSIDDENMLEKAKMLYEGNSSVVEFNRDNLYYEALS